MASIGQTGRAMKMAFAKYGTNSWGVAASVTKGVYFEGLGGLSYRPAKVTDNAFNQAFIGQDDAGLVEAPSISLTGRDRYDDHQYILQALAMGSPSAVTISTSATSQTTSWLHVFNLADSIDGLGATFALDMNQFVHELTSAKVMGFELTQGDGGSIQTTYQVIGSKPTILSSVNINSTLAGANYPTLGNRVMQQQGVFRMNANSGGALAAGDAQRVESVRFAFSRPQDAPFVYGQDFVDEPADNGWPEFTIEVTYPRMNTVSANSLYAGLINNVAYKADWTFSSSTFINSTDRWTEKYEWPYLQLMQDGYQADPAGANQVKPKAKFAARLAPTSPTGMAFVRPFRLTRIMVNSVTAF